MLFSGEGYQDIRLFLACVREGLLDRPVSDGSSPDTVDDRPCVVEDILYLSLTPVSQVCLQSVLTK
ncbi:hypothetical protein [Rhizobium sp. BK176]|uniref:hypothetical protein n=1 Tax=Rhizobium sp. BK176 TaxID=2587071 RepID=UPI00216A01E6|nr:hypothetical protein [Rhizobium sp. BK176]MCS4089998.1 hypothetical protein [Rhizobium sp. BK176]